MSAVMRLILNSGVTVDVPVTEFTKEVSPVTGHFSGLSWTGTPGATTRLSHVRLDSVDAVLWVEEETP